MANNSKITYGMLLRVVTWYILGIQNSMFLPFANKLNWISRHFKGRRQFCGFWGSSQTFKLQMTMGSCQACSHHLNGAPDMCSRGSLKKKRLCALHVKVKFLIFIHQITSFIILIYLNTWHLIAHVTNLGIILHLIPSLNYQKILYLNLQNIFQIWQLLTSSCYLSCQNYHPLLLGPLQYHPGFRLKAHGRFLRTEGEVDIDLLVQWLRLSSGSSQTLIILRWSETANVRVTTC